MLKKLLTAGTVYAANVRYIAGLAPALLLSDTLLHQDTGSASSAGTITKARAGARPCEEWNYRQGYAIVYFTPATVSESNKLTAAQQSEILGQIDVSDVVRHIIEQKKLGLPEFVQALHPRLSVMLINNAKLVGLWAEMGPDQEEKIALSAQYDREGIAWETERNVAIGSVRSSLAAILGEVTLPGGSAAYLRSEPRSGLPGLKRHQGYVSLSLEQAQRLIAMLPKDYS